MKSLLVDIDNNLKEVRYMATNRPLTDAEKVVLGSILLDNKRMDEVLTWLTPANFSCIDGLAIFSTMKRLHETKKPIDILNILESWKNDKGQPVLLSASLLTSLTENIPNDLNLEPICMSILESSLLPNQNLRLAERLVAAHPPLARPEQSQQKTELQNIVDAALPIPKEYWRRQSYDKAAVSFSADFARRAVIEAVQTTLDLVDERISKQIEEWKSEGVVASGILVSAAEAIRKTLREIR